MTPPPESPPVRTRSLPRSLDGTPRRPPEHRPEAATPEGRLDCSLLLAALYADIFDYPLTVAELVRYRVAVRGASGDPGAALERLLDGPLRRVNGYLCRPGREETCELRRRRRRDAAPRWRLARRYARWLARVPFVRMVAVCGSQAMENAGPRSDVDVFCLTEPGRLWVAQAAAMSLRRLAPERVCPNYFLSLDRLEVEEKNLYTAHEVAQVVPLWGEAAYERFLAANRWVRRFLPSVDFADRRRHLAPDPPRPEGWERRLGGRGGDLLDRLLHRLLLRYYALRWRRHGVTARDLRRSYDRHRQTVVHGGYTATVATAFGRRLGEVLNPEAAARELRRLFPGEVARDEAADGLFTRLYGGSYGSGGD